MPPLQYQWNNETIEQCKIFLLIPAYLPHYLRNLFPKLHCIVGAAIMRVCHIQIGYIESVNWCGKVWFAFDECGIKNGLGEWGFKMIQVEWRNLFSGSCLQRWFYSAP